MVHSLIRSVPLGLLTAVLLTGCGSGAFQDPGVVEDRGQPSARPTTNDATISLDRSDRSDAGEVQPTAASTTGSSAAEEPAGGTAETEPGLSLFSLPQGPLTPADVREDDVYVPLAAGDCAGARTALTTYWRDLDSPRSVLLYEAGVSLCRQDRGAATSWFAEAGSNGWSGIDTEFYVTDEAG